LRNRAVAGGYVLFLEVTMKTSAVVVLVAAFTIAGGLAVMNKACKTSPHPWCVQAFYEKNGKALNHGGRTRARVPQGAPAGPAAVS
jgi:hypothetical protein